MSQSSGTPSSGNPSSGNIDSQLDNLINRIHALSGDKADSANPEEKPSAADRTANPGSANQTAFGASPRKMSQLAPSSATVAERAVSSSGKSLAGSSENPRQPPGQNRPAPARPSAAPPAPARPRPNQPAGYAPSRDEPWRPAEPESLRSAHINETLVESIIFRYILNTGEIEGRRIADQVELRFLLV
ncbi:MAG: hypothetical protein ACF787_01000 [Rhodopirellula sp. JB053]